MPSGADVWQAIERRWQLAGIDARPGAAAADLDAFERCHGVRLPAAMREFYAHLGGMLVGAWDEALLTFWPLTEVGPVPALLSGYRGIPDYGGIEAALPDAGSYFAFADHSIWLSVYAVRLSADPDSPCPVVWISGDLWRAKSPSSGEFLRLYAEDPWRVVF